MFESAQIIVVMAILAEEDARAKRITASAVYYKARKAEADARQALEKTEKEQAALCAEKLDLRGLGWQPWRNLTIWLDYRAGASFAKLALEYDMSPSSIRHIVKKIERESGIEPRARRLTPEG